MGSGTRLDRPSSAKGSRRRKSHHQEEGETGAGKMQGQCMTSVHVYAPVCDQSECSMKACNDTDSRSNRQHCLNLYFQCLFLTDNNYRHYHDFCVCVCVMEMGCSGAEWTSDA